MCRVLRIRTSDDVLMQLMDDAKATSANPRANVFLNVITLFVSQIERFGRRGLQQDAKTSKRTAPWSPSLRRLRVN
jgi:hypothetical protein